MNNKCFQKFDELLRDLSNIKPDVDGQILCPLCLKGFGRAAIDSRELTEEHIIPQAVGGRDITLTCRECNNDDGSWLDSQLVRKLETDNALRGYGPIPTDIYIAGHKMTAEVEWGREVEDTNVIRVICRRSNPRSVEAAKQALLGGEKKMDLKMKFGYVMNRFRLGLVRIAYLSMFDCFGYRYILSESVENVRRLIRLRECHTGLLARMMIDISNTVGNFQSPLIIPVEDLTKDTFYIVAIRLAYRNISYIHGVIMPAAIPNAENVYDELEILSRQSPGFKMTVKLPS
ncbi:MAG: HNH endonuclease [Candidatus Competibacteraceae bacterium]